MDEGPRRLPEGNRWRKELAIRLAYGCGLAPLLALLESAVLTTYTIRTYKGPASILGWCALRVAPTISRLYVTAPSIMFIPITFNRLTDVLIFVFGGL